MKSKSELNKNTNKDTNKDALNKDNYYFRLKVLAALAGVTVLGTVSTILMFKLAATAASATLLATAAATTLPIFLLSVAGALTVAGALAFVFRNLCAIPSTTSTRYPNPFYSPIFYPPPPPAVYTQGNYHGHDNTNRVPANNHHGHGHR